MPTALPVANPDRRETAAVDSDHRHARDGHAVTTPPAVPKKRRRLGLAFLLFFLSVLGLLGALGYAKYRNVMAAMAMGEVFAPPPAAVTTAKVQRGEWQPTLRAIGTLEAVQGVTVAADLAGVVKELKFESGGTARAGDVLVRLETDQEQAALASAEAMRDLMIVSLRRQKDLLEKKATSQSDYDSADAQFRQAEANVASSKAMIARKTIRAPFAGQIGIRKANLGQYLRDGDPVVSLQAIDPIRVNFSLPQQNLAAVAVGTEVRVKTDATGTREFVGKINAINSLVDESTRNFQAQATLANADNALRPGMFANVEIVLPERQNVLPVPASAIAYAPYGDSVFIVEMVPDVKDKEKKKKVLGVRQQFVTLGPTRGDLVAVTKGLKEGEEVVTSGVFKLQNGAAVQVNNSVQPGSDAAPKPEDS